MNKEIWKPIKGYDRYEVSTHGRVRSFCSGQAKLIKPGILNRGYPYVGLTCSATKKRKSVTIHRLVALTHIPNPKNKATVNHKDGEKLNNHVDNLEWMTNVENVRHGHAEGIRTGKRGEVCNFTKIDEFKALTIHTLLPHWSQYKIADHYGLKQASISCMKHGKSWNWMGLYKMHINSSNKIITKDENE